MESLADYLESIGQAPRREGPPQPPPLEDIADSRSFAKAVLESREFRQYILNGLVLGSIPAAILIRVMDLAGWQKPPERIEHSGRVENITEVRRVVIHVDEHVDVVEEQKEDLRIIH